MLLINIDLVPQWPARRRNALFLNNKYADSFLFSPLLVAGLQTGKFEVPYTSCTLMCLQSNAYTLSWTSNLLSFVKSNIIICRSLWFCRTEIASILKEQKYLFTRNSCRRKSSPGIFLCGFLFAVWRVWWEELERALGWHARACGLCVHEQIMWLQRGGLVGQLVLRVTWVVIFLCVVFHQGCKDPCCMCGLELSKGQPWCPL